MSIDDTELNNLRAILNELYGEENFVAVLVWDRNRKNDAKFFSVGHEYMVVYARDKQYLKNNDIILRAPKEGLDDLKVEYERLGKTYGNDPQSVARGLKEWFKNMEDDDPRKPLARFNKIDERGPYRDDADISWPGGGGPMYDVLHPITGKPCKKPKRGWVFPTKVRMDEEIEKGNVAFGPDETTVPWYKSHLFERAEQVMSSVHYSYAQTASQEFDKIFDGIRVFDNPKYYVDLSQIVEYLTGADDLILDFFAGSCSTAHALLFSNRTKSSARRFICIQLPEPVNRQTLAGRNAFDLGLKTVADIGKERIRRVVTRMKKDREGQLALEKPEDLGFKVFKLAPSNYRQWDDTQQDANAYARQAELFTDPLAQGWQPENVLYEVALKEGYGLNVSVESTPAKDVQRVTDPDKDQSFYITLAGKIVLNDLRPLDLKKDDLFICRDSALDDEAAANLALQCRLKTI